MYLHPCNPPPPSTSVGYLLKMERFECFRCVLLLLVMNARILFLRFALRNAAAAAATIGLRRGNDLRCRAFAYVWHPQPRSSADDLLNGLIFVTFQRVVYNCSITAWPCVLLIVRARIHGYAR